jgi:hypothetical protein
MEFDIKDVKSWCNRHDVKKGDEGYFADSIEELKTEDNRTRTIEDIFDDEAFCFRTPSNKYSFFLPLDAVKVDKPKEKKYRPFKKIKDFHDCGVIKGKDDCLIDSVLTLRDKKNYNLTRDMKVIDVEYDFDTVIRINRCSLAYFFSYFDIYINDEWVPFGVEVKDED